uniref:Anticodon_1 domain-containing protein n=1 Tax=Rhodnius prolixus TaxID=13249 RepID=T1ICK7_RHOPR
MELMNKLAKAPQESKQDRALTQEALLAVVRMLYPFTPHACFTLWQALCGNGDIDTAPWPVADEDAMVEDSKLVVVQVNGKVRGRITVAADATQEQVQSRAAQEHLVAKYLEGVTDGTTAEYQLVLTIQAQVLLPGEDIYPLSVTVFRTFFDNPLAALAKNAEQDIIRKEMRRQAAEQLVRKLVTINGSDEVKTASNVPPPSAITTGVHDPYLSGTACRAAQ